jgi:hypothetical protein
MGVKFSQLPSAAVTAMENGIVKKFPVFSSGELLSLVKGFHQMGFSWEKSNSLVVVDLFLHLLKAVSESSSSEVENSSKSSKEEFIYERIHDYLSIIKYDDDHENYLVKVLEG